MVVRFWRNTVYVTRLHTIDENINLEPTFQTINGIPIDPCRISRLDFMGVTDDFDRCEAIFAGKNIDCSTVLRGIAVVVDRPVLTIRERILPGLAG